MPIVETGFSSANATVDSHVGPLSSVVVEPSPASSAVDLASTNSVIEAPLARSLDDSPEVASMQQQGQAVSEGDSWML